MLLIAQLEPEDVNLLLVQEEVQVSNEEEVRAAICPESAGNCSYTMRKNPNVFFSTNELEPFD